MDDQPVKRDKFQEALDAVRVAMLEDVAAEREKTIQAFTAWQERFEKRLGERFFPLLDSVTGRPKAGLTGESPVPPKPDAASPTNES
jgi:hypothetical protein